jgi:hypothetical protein
MEPNEKGEINETMHLTLEIIENENNTTFGDEGAKYIVTPKYFIVKSEKFNDIKLKDNDIVRVIKEDANKYRCEIIRANTNEYKIWEEFCKTSVKGSSKKFGIM